MHNFVVFQMCTYWSCLVTSCKKFFKFIQRVSVPEQLAGYVQRGIIAKWVEFNRQYVIAPYYLADSRYRFNPN